MMRTNNIIVVLIFCFLAQIQSIVAQVEAAPSVVLPDWIVARREVIQLLTYSDSLLNKDNYWAYHHAVRAYALANQLDDPYLFLRACVAQGQGLRRLELYASGLGAFHRALDIANEYGLHQYDKYIYNGLGVCYTFLLKYDLALKYHYLSLELREKEKNEQEISTALNNIGLVYYKLEDPDNGIAYLTRALDIEKRNGDKRFEAGRILANLALCHLQKRDYAIGERLALEALKSFGQINSLHEVYYVLGLLSDAKGKPSKAADYFLKSDSLANVIGNLRFQADSKIKLAEVKLKRREFKEAENLLRRAERMAKGTDTNDIWANFFDQSSRLYSALGDFKRAIGYQQKFVQLQDSINGAEFLINISRVRMEFAERENLARIEAQSQILKFQKQALTQQKWLNVAAVAIALLFIILAWVLYNISRQRQLINRQLDQRVKERTFELEQHRDQLRHLHEEKSIALIKISQKMNASLASLKGLSEISRHSHPDQTTYVQEAYQIVSGLFIFVKQVSGDE